MPLHFVTFIIGVVLGGYCMWHHTKAYRLETNRMRQICIENNRAIDAFFYKVAQGQPVGPWDRPSSEGLG